MKARVIRIVALTALALAAPIVAEAAAAKPAIADTQSFSISVVIPDFTAARAALAENAAGAWTLFTGAGGLMVSTPNSAPGATGQVAVFRSDANQLTASQLPSPTAAPGPELKPIQDTAFSGLHRLGFQAPADGNLLLLSGV